MACWWFSVIVLSCLQYIFASACPQLRTISTCDECMRCGGIWCNSPDENGARCSSSSDSWCPNDEEIPYSLPTSAVEGSTINLKYLERSIVVGKTDYIELQFNGKGPVMSSNVKIEDLVHITIINSTIQNLSHSSLEKDIQLDNCIKGKCLGVKIEVMPTLNFCPSTGTKTEFVTLKIQVKESKEETIAKYHVPCSCTCNDFVVRNSQNCSGRGDFACGTCTCHEGWQGETCQHKVPTHPTKDCDRGDTPSTCENQATGQVCSNNGRCVCGKCECYRGTGQDYYGDYCEDICSYTSSWCDDCIANPTTCKECKNLPLVIDSRNDSIIANDVYNVWTMCNLTTDDGSLIEYEATKEKNGFFHVMIIDRKTVDPYMAGPGVNVTLPVVLGIVAIVAAAAAVAGYMVWKNRTPPLPPADLGDYTNLDAEDCTGINPLYKSPNSCYKNPLYGSKI